MRTFVPTPRHDRVAEKRNPVERDQQSRWYTEQQADNPQERLHGRGSVPNELKLSDGGRESKELDADATPPFAGARC